MELPVVIFVSAVTGAISSVIVQIIFRKTSTTSTVTPDMPAQNLFEPTPPTPVASPIDEKEAPQPSLEEEEQDEGEILTLSDVSHSVPELGRFKDLNIPSIDDDSIQVSDVQIPSAESTSTASIPPTAPPQAPAESPSTELEPTTVPEHDNLEDDEATVLVQRTPPK